jgi:hypothetical protein
MKIRSVGAKLCRAGGQAGVTNLIVAFRNFVAASKHFWKVDIIS